MNFIALISILLYACLEVKCDNQTDAVAAQLQFLINEERDLRKNLETRVQRLRNEAATINSTIGKGFVYFCDCSVIVAPNCSRGSIFNSNETWFHFKMAIVLFKSVSCFGGLFCCYILDESICHFRGFGFVLSLLFYF